MEQPKFNGGIVFYVDYSTVSMPFLNTANANEEFSKETLSLFPFVDQYANTHVKAISFNTFSRSSATPSNVWTDYITVHDYKEENGVPVDYSDSWTGLYKCYKELGIDPYEIWFDRCHQQGIEAWMSIRMNDCKGGGDSTYHGRSEFFYEAKKNGWMVGLLPGHGLYYHYCLDYAVPEVRQKMLQYFDEQLDRYNVDALELDFTREIICFKYSTCSDKVEIMNDFIRNVKKIIEKAGTKHGHKIKLTVRLYRDIDQCKEFGFDAETWDKEGLVDFITVSPRWLACDSDMPIDVWKKRCPNTAISAGMIQNYTIPYNKKSNDDGQYIFRKDTPVDAINAMTAAYVSEGADAVTLYVSSLDPFAGDWEFREKYTGRLIRRIGKDNTIFSTRRRHIVTYQEYDTVPAGYEAYQPLPLEITRGGHEELSLPIGYVPVGKSARLVIGFLYGRPGDVDISVNGKKYTELIKDDSPKIASDERNVYKTTMPMQNITVYSCNIYAESLMRYVLTFDAKDDVIISYIEVDIT